MILAIILLIYFVFGAFGCLLVCVDRNDPGILGKMSRLFLGKLPEKVGAFVKKVFGQRVFNFFGKAKHYIVETNHPLVQIFYIVIAPGGFIGYITKGVMVFMPNKYVGEYQVAFAIILALFCFWIYYKACSVPPGRITKNNEEFYVKKYQNYVDGILYKPKNKCETCKTFKPARSKHCRTCDVCWAKFDHHCIWIRQCVGEKNYKYFVSFLFFHAILCLYYSVIGSLSIKAYIQSTNMLSSSFYIGGQYVKADYIIILSYLFMSHTLFIFLIIMCFILGVTLLIFVLYHFYLISQNMTSNERAKSSDYISELKTIIKNQNKMLQQKGGWQQMPAEIQYYQRKYNTQQLKKLFKRNQQDLEYLSKWKGKGFIQNMKTVFKE